MDLDLIRPRRSRTDPAQGAQYPVRRYGRFIGFAATLDEFGEYPDVTTLRRADPP